MDFLKEIKSSIKDFGKIHMEPNILEWDDKQIFPLELLKKLGELGFMGVLVPQKYGGSGLSYKEYITIIDEISQIDSSIGLSVAAHNSLCVNHILNFANEEQKQKYLPKLASSENIGAWALTEPDSGSDSKNMNTFAKLENNTWILNGSKNFITHAISGNVIVVLANTSHGISSFIVEKGTKGLNSGKKNNKLGMRASETAELFFDNCVIPKENLIGNVGDGFKQAMKILDGGRISIASLALGISKGAYKIALNYSKERKQFNQPISNFQSISFKLAEMATKIEISELLTRKAGDLMDNNEHVTKLSAMCKLYSADSCVEISNEAVQILGGYGYTKEYLVEKFYRDSKLCTIGEGTSEIQKIVISRDILK